MEIPGANVIHGCARGGQGPGQGSEGVGGDMRITGHDAADVALH